MAKLKATARLEQLACPDCAAMIGRVVAKLKGVQAAEVRYTTNKLLVEYDDAQVAWDAVENTVRRLGYRIESVEQEELK